jgi:hypothetical protein
MNNTEIGTFVDGIISTEDVDSSGEIIEIKGIDITSIFDNKDTAINWEHKSETASQIVGKLLFAKKILKESDCENERHEHFWKLNRNRPYLYGYGVLFDKLGHQSAKDVVAIFSFADIFKKGQEKADIGFSIEGSRLHKEGNVIKKCILRSLAITQKQCNKMCVAEKMKEEDVLLYTQSIAKKKIEDSMKKAEKINSDMFKTEEQPKKKFKKSLENPIRKAIKSYISNLSDKTKTPTKEHNTYNTNLAEPKKVTPSKPSTRDYIPIPKTSMTSRDKDNKPITREGTEPKKLHSTVYRPNKVVTGRSIWDEKKSEKFDKNEIKTEAIKILSEDAWSNFAQKETLIASIKKTQPELNDSEALAIAKTFAYIKLKKDEAELSDLFEKGKEEKETEIKPVKKNKRWKKKNV